MIIKWAGGKRWLYQKIHNLLPREFNNYIEPFFGGGAFFYSFEAKLSGYAGDLNKNLISCHQKLKDNPKELFEKVSELIASHSDEQYYQIRDEYNASHQPDHFLYLNRTCFNGIYRENRNGDFNVPAGKRHTGSLFNYNLDDFLSLSEKLKNMQLINGDFRSTLSYAGAKDFIYIDPPYLDREIDGKKSSTFRKYNSKEFDEKDLSDLSEILTELSSKGAHILISNYSVPAVKEFFPKTMGWNYIDLDRVSYLSGKSSGRHKTSEICIHNFSL